MTAHPSRFRPRLLWALALSAALTGCATMQSHDKLATDMQTAGRSGGIPAALASLESTAKTEEEKTALLYNMERYIARLATTPYTTTKKLTARGGRTQHGSAPGGGARAASTRLDRTSTTHAVFAAPSLGRGCCAAARGKRGVFLVSNRPICKEHP